MQSHSSLCLENDMSESTNLMVFLKPVVLAAIACAMTYIAVAVDGGASYASHRLPTAGRRPRSISRWPFA
jgi:hypothetical protein